LSRRLTTLEIPPLAPNESKFSLAGSLGIINTAAGKMPKIMDKKVKKVLTLCLLRRGGNILLGMKKRGFGQGRWNGFGGKVEEGETIREAAIREVREEAGIEPSGLVEKGRILFEFESEPKKLEVHIFDVTRYKGEPAETEEMRPQWFAVNEIPFRQMWADDEHWFPFFLAGKKFAGSFLFDRPADGGYAGKILDKKLSEVKELPEA